MSDFFPVICVWEQKSALKQQLVNTEQSKGLCNEDWRGVNLTGTNIFEFVVIGEISAIFSSKAKRTNTSQVFLYSATLEG